jgi:tRNA1Val (adenine37-N6)-methyltransferase
MVKSHERVDDLQLKGLQIIQNPDWFCFGIDAVLLADFVQANKRAKIMDLCTGNGIVPLLLHGKNKGAKIYGLEIQAEIAEMAQRSVSMNGLDEVISIQVGDASRVREMEKPHSFDVVTMNPPYKPVGGGMVNPTDHKAIARHEITAGLESLIESAAYLLNSQGRFYMVHRPQRLVEIISLMKKHGIEPKRIRLIYPKEGRRPNIVLIKGIRGGKADLIMDPAFFVYDENGEYRPEVHKAYEDIWKK